MQNLIMLVGSNPEEAHPVVGMQIRQAIKRGCKLIVVDPRDIGLAKKADIHLKLKPGTNVAFANGIMNVILSEGLQDDKFIAERTEGFEELKEIGPDALIIADPGVFDIAKEVCPEIERHISTQANNTNYGTYNFWYRQGASVWYRQENCRCRN